MSLKNIIKKTTDDGFFVHTSIIPHRIATYGRMPSAFSHDVIIITHLDLIKSVIYFTRQLTINFMHATVKFFFNGQM